MIRLFITFSRITAGYLWGECVTQLGSSPASRSDMVGSVTPQGKIQLNFTDTSSNSSPSITEGFGTMQFRRGHWTMENQMFTDPSDRLQIGHWAYMAKCAGQAELVFSARRRRISAGVPGRPRRSQGPCRQEASPAKSGEALLGVPQVDRRCRRRTAQTGPCLPCRVPALPAPQGG